jgi:hypothetical protein
MIRLASVALVPLRPAMALIFLARWLHGEDESHFEPVLGDSGVAVRCPRQVRAAVAVRQPPTNPFAHPAASH